MIQVTPTEVVDRKTKSMHYFMSRTIDRQLVCSEAFSWEALPKGALKYVVAGGTIKDLNLRTYAVLNCGFTILHMTRPWSCHFQRRILHAQYAATSLQTLFCCHVATVSAEAVWSAVGTQGYVSVRYAGKKPPSPVPPPIWLWKMSVKLLCRSRDRVPCWKRRWTAICTGRS